MSRQSGGNLIQDILKNSKVFTLTTQILSRQSRSLSLYAVRFSVLLVCVIIFLSASDSYRISGLDIFNFISIANLIFLTFASMRYFGSIISDEKEQGTIGLLLLTPLHPVSILSAKAYPMFHAMAAILVAQIPLITFCVTLGGVVLSQVFIFYILCVFYLMFLCGLFLPCSSLVRKTGDALGLTFLSLVFVNAFPAILDVCNRLYFQNDHFSNVVYHLTNMQTWKVWSSLVSGNLEVSTFAIYMAGCTVTLILGTLLSLHWIRKVDLSDPTAKKDKGKNQSKTRASKNRCWNQANIWKDWNFFAGGKKRMIAKAGFALLIMVSLPLFSGHNQVKFLNEKYFEVFLQINLPLSIIAFLIEYISHVSNFIAKEVKGKTLSGVLLQPLTVEEFFLSKIKAAALSSIVTFSIMFTLVICSPQLVGPSAFAIFHIRNINGNFSFNISNSWLYVWRDWLSKGKDMD